jgi:hypothetical protein
VEDEHTRGTRALESTIEAIAQEIRVSWLVYRGVRCRWSGLVWSHRQHYMILFYQNTCIKWISMLYAFFWVICRRLKFICQCFGTLSVPSSGRQVPARLWRSNRQCSKTLAYKLQRLANHPEESIQHSELGESLKSRISMLLSRISSGCALRHLRITWEFPVVSGTQSFRPSDMSSCHLSSFF